MKTKLSSALLAVSCLTTAISFAQPRENSNPYAIFGSKPFIAGEEASRERVKVFVIENIAEGSRVARLEHDTETGVIEFFDLDGMLIGQKQLAKGERAWMSIDKKAEKYYSISPYAYTGNNPVRYVDPNGMEFTEAAWEWVRKLIADVDSRQKSNNQGIESKQAQLAAGGLSEKQTNRLNRQIGRLQNDNASLDVVRGEVAVLAASDQVYNVSESNSMNVSGPVPGMGEDRAGIGFNNRTGSVEILMPSNGGMGLFSHELKHAYQFETGAMSMATVRGVPSILHDKSDEYEGYARGSMFRGDSHIGTLPSIYDHLSQGPIDATTHPSIGPSINNPTQLQNIANQFNNAFRVNGVTYRPR